MITAAITQKSSTVLCCLRRWKLVLSNMRKATTMRMPASAAMGTQPTRRLSSRKTKSENTPSNTPDKREVPPLPRLTRVAPMVPAPGMPPTSADTILPAPWPTSSRFDRCRLRVSASTTTQVLSVSMDSSAERVRAGTSSVLTVARLSRPRPCQRSTRLASTEPPVSAMGPMTSGLCSRRSKLPSRRPRPK